MQKLIESIEKMKEYKNGLWDIVRIVDPVEKRVIDTWMNDDILSQEEIERFRKEESQVCYKFWNTGKVCENCTSMQAINMGKRAIKMKFNGKKAYLVTAIPMSIDGRKYAIELMNDISEAGIIEEISKKTNAEIYGMIEEKNKLLVTDPLTQIYNKRFILERLPYEVSDASKSDSPLFIAMADIDFFKKVNDTYGHQAGDFILKEFASLISKSIRTETDWVARYGGEEFMVFMKNASIENVKAKMERIRLRIEESVFSYEGTEIRITSSFGIAKLEENMDITGLIEKSDRNLYMAKTLGRNRLHYE